MLEKLELKNFKCFDHIAISLRNLNVFSGMNGMGKSTCLQALLLLRQSHQQGFLPKQICLNNDMINLGMAQDVLFEKAEEDMIRIEVSEKERGMAFDIESEKDHDILNVSKEGADALDFFERAFEYLNADRKSPQVIYPKSSFYIDTKCQLGVSGEYSVHYLTRYQDETITWNACDEESISLKYAVQYWLNEISPNIKIDVSDIENTDFTKLGFYYLEETRSRTFRPTNVGFGISYVLPVIISLLKASPDSILIIENPEAHLHPRGQRKMGELIARCAQSGVQIFLETHSDHLLNGIRVSVKNKNIDSQNVKLYYFYKDECNEHVFATPHIKDNGRLSEWPDGFFDEWEKALDEII